MNPWMTFAALLLMAFLLIGAEIYVPGGVLGTIGLICLGAAVVMGFRMGPGVGWISLMIVLFIGILGAVFWLKFFPRSPTGRRLTLAYDGRTFKSGVAGLSDYLGRIGVAQSPLRPAGMAKFDGKRMDVVAENGVWIDADEPVRVCRVGGNRLYVEPAPTDEREPAGATDA